MRSPGSLARGAALVATAAVLASGTFCIASARVPLIPRQNGISGFSGQFGTDCNSCHSGGTAPTVELTGPVYVLLDSTRKYTFTVSGGQAFAAGLDVSTDAGALVASETGTHLDNSEVTHDAPKLVDGAGVATFTFDLTAPSSTGPLTLYAAGNSVDGNGRNFGDAAATTTLQVEVVDNLTSFVEFGVALAGSGAIEPRLVGIDGPSIGPWSIAVEEGLGGAAGLLWAGIATKDQAAFGGHFYVDLGVLPWIALPVVLDGTAGVPGDGSFDVAGADVSAFAPLTLYLQATLLDAGAVRKISITNALQMDVTK
jgi:hypothetical protein